MTEVESRPSAMNSQSKRLETRVCGRQVHDERGPCSRISQGTRARLEEISQHVCKHTSKEEIEMYNV